MNPTEVILLVDGHPAPQTLQAVAEIGPRVISVGDSIDALASVVDERIDLAIINCTLGPKSGSELAQSMYAKFSKFPCILHGTKEQITHARSSLDKPHLKSGMCQFIETTAIAKRLKYLTAPFLTSDGPSILFVEDSGALRMVVQRILAGNGYNLTVAVDGVDGLNKVKENSYDMIISDINMPNMNGIAFVEAARQLPEHAKTPIVMATTESSRSAIMALKKYSIQGWIVKPYDEKTLLEQVKKVLEEFPPRKADATA